MSAARNQILAAVRKAKPARASATIGRQALLPPKFVREARDLVALFAEKLANVSTSVAMLDHASEIPLHLAQWLGEHGLRDKPLLLAEEPSLRALDWSTARLDARAGAPDVPAPATIVSGAFAGVAETGSIAMVTNGASRPSHNILADSHIVVLSRSQIAASIEDVWRAASERGLPRSLAFITGASRTADIEMTMELGVHGAVRMHVVLINDEISSVPRFSR
ncbi:MAG: LUD domain-containing protein [Alphaproteobacteria bacterium]